MAGGDITVGSAVVSHGGVTLTIGADAGGATTPGDQGQKEGSTQAVRVQSGASVQKVAAALQAVQTSPSEIAAIFESLREIGAIAAEVTIR
jgi:flagellar basal body P-ring protein FlgI